MKHGIMMNCRNFRWLANNIGEFVSARFFEDGSAMFDVHSDNYKRCVLKYAPLVVWEPILDEDLDIPSFDSFWKGIGS
jgi:hypothetical protein